ncbi:iron-containing alcohol dehydrogenase [Glaciecola sp. 33A]|jgi:alcohol dehydrogenase class IV|uniref:iron-containing alcohol dehydrogenase n=1 Tax=Glaciecola sp. 33A TaxID=2057807 RepID=UPI000C328D2C|nr:iron-containing alcohol dehydrogenase [Glaciecola sp. 33A]PKI02013.1 alcohol dehydrogenase [Glaciecola sp. 33A]
MSTQIVLPRILQIGADAASKVVEVINSLGCYRPIILTDKTMVELGYVQALLAQFNDSEQLPDVFDNTIPEPTVASIILALEKVKSEPYDCIIALGGGSPIDSAKAVAVLATLGGEMKDYKFPHIQTQPGLPVIAIPTTAGTGSEVTKFTIITDQETDEKMLCAGPGFMPAAALIDYTLTLSLPPRTTADTGIDALTHAIEAYVSKKANLYSDSQALAAMKLLAPNLREAYRNGKNKVSREAMMLGATLAGLAFSNASVALVHGMSRPIGAFFHVPHGLSNAMLLPSVTAFSIAGACPRYAMCARTMGIATNVDSDEHACGLLIKELQQLNDDLNVPTPKDFGIEKESFFEVCETMAKQALASGSPGNNPIVPSIEEMVAIYHGLWSV